jgi:hypothetical protein
MKYIVETGSGAMTYIRSHTDIMVLTQAQCYFNIFKKRKVG